MQMNRRKFVLTGAATGTAIGLGGMPALAKDNLTGVIYFTPTYKAIIEGARGFTEAYNAAGKSAVTMDLFDSGQLVKADEQLPALRSGNIDMMFHATSYVTRSLPILGIVGLPGVVEDLYENPDRLAMGSPLLDLINEELAKQNLFMPTLGGGVLQPEYIWSRKGETVKGLSDLAGKKLRIAGYEATQAMENLGASAVRLPSSEVYLALQRGIVDAAVANVATVVGRSLQEQLSGCYKLPITGYTVAPFVLLDRWQKMPETHQNAFMEASEWYDTNLISNSRSNVYPEYWKTVEAAGITVIDPSPEDLAKFADASKSVQDAWIAEVGEDVGQRAIALATGNA